MQDNKLFFDAWDIVVNTDYYIYLFIGGRGVGKTYSVLRGAVLDSVNFMYVRRSETELKNSCTANFNPFNVINRDYNKDIQLQAASDTYNIVNGEEVIGTAGALTTFGKFRGADYGTIDYTIFDEFIRTNNYKIKGEDFLYFNMLETIGRNREILGKPPLKNILLSNANTIDNDIIKSLKLGEQIRLLKETKQSIYTDKERGIYLQLINNDNFVAEKKKTALYKLTKGTAFYDMALDNEFTGDFFGDIKRLNYKDLKPLFKYDKMTFYQVKQSDKIYISYRSANCETYTVEDFTKFKKLYSAFIFANRVAGNLIYCDYDIKLSVLNLFT